MKTTKSKIYRNLYLPNSLNKDLKSLAKTKIQLYKFYYLMSFLCFRERDDFKNIKTFRPMGSGLLIKLFSSKYYEVINPLREEGIIECDDFFHEGKSFCYRINPNYFIDEKLVKVKYSYIMKLPLNEFLDNKYERDVFINNFNKLYIPFRLLYMKLKEKLDNLSIQDFKTNEQIDFDGPELVIIEKDYIFKTIRLTKEKALKEAEIKGMSLIKDKKHIVMMYESEFLSDKRRNISISWNSMIENLKSEDTLYAKRDATSRRLHTNFTILPKDLFKIISENECLIELDLSNAQPALLAHVLKTKNVKGIGVQKFIDLTTKGIFYEFFEKELKVSREEAKNMMFVVLFGSRIPGSKKKDLFKREFPAVSFWIDDYKKSFGDNSLAIMLQKEESNLFINQIYKPLTEQGITLFSKHDSISFFSFDKEIVTDWVHKVFEKNGFEGQLKSNELELLCAS